MTQYVKKRIPVEAVEFNPDRDGTMPAFRKLIDFAGQNVIDVDPEDWEDPGIPEWAVWDKLHNVWVPFYAGDWIIKGLEGEFYPHNGELFPKVYEEYDENE